MAMKHSGASWPVIRAYLLLPHAVPIVVVLLATLAFAIVATGGHPGGVTLASLLIAMLGGQLAVGATNELTDVEMDRISKPSKPIPAGLVTQRGASTVVVVGLILMIAGSLRFSLLAGFLCALGTGTGMAYSLWFKRTIWSWLPYVLAIPLLPIWVWVALASPPAAMIMLYPIAAPALVAVHIAQSIPDIEGDRSAGIENLTVRLGSNRSRLACSLLVSMSIALAIVSSALMAARPTWCWLAGGIALGLVITNSLIWRQNNDWGRKTSFPLMAAAVVILGVGWTISSLP